MTVPSRLICAGFFLLTSAVASAAPPPPKPRVPGIKVGQFPVEVLTVFDKAYGLPSDDILSIAVLPNGSAFAGTSAGLSKFENGKWEQVPKITGPVRLLTPYQGGVLVIAQNHLHLIRGTTDEVLGTLPGSTAQKGELRSLSAGKSVVLGTKSGLLELGPGGFTPVAKLNIYLGSKTGVRQVAAAADGRVAVASASGLFLRSESDSGLGSWKLLLPFDGVRSWAPRDVRGVAFDSKGSLWFASPQGVGSFDGHAWHLFTGSEGLPYNDFTCMAAGENGVVWFGTTLGAIRFDGSHWNYRQGRRWVPDDQINGIAVADNGDAWFATPHGVGRLERRPMTLADKAAFFEKAIDKYHRRTPYGYVLAVHLPKAGDVSNYVQYDSDNDGLWTSMYGAGECFAYAATHDPEAKRRATAAFEALRFLSTVTQGGPHPAPKGFPARTVLPTSGPDPNKHDSVEHDKQQQRREPLWKVISPRWPKSADGKWYWKTDTSSDELDGHYFMYALYYDLVAETEAERQPVRELVADITGHIIDHDFDLVDHDGKPTRWARFGPKTLNQVQWATGRGLNSLSILSYLLAAEHITGQKRFREAFDHLVKDHAYLANIVFAKSQFGPSTGNQSDDEMAFMGFYNLLHYAKDPQVRMAGNLSLRQYFSLEQPEDSPLFNFIFAASYTGFGHFQRSIPSSNIVDGVDFLKRYPLDRIDWNFQNSHRLDIVRLTGNAGREYRNPRGHRPNGKVLPIDERFIEHWNYDGYTLDNRGQGHMFSDGASFLLPYYMGRYFGFIEESEPGKNASASR